MPRPGRTGERLAALFILGTLLFNPPFLSIFNWATQVLGLPLLYFYLFLAWALVIAVTALLIERTEADSERAQRQPSPGQPGETQGADD